MMEMSRIPISRCLYYYNFRAVLDTHRGYSRMIVTMFFLRMEMSSKLAQAVADLSPGGTLGGPIDKSLSGVAYSGHLDS